MEVLAQSQHTKRDKEANVVLDIESLVQPPEKCSGSPKMTRALSRKGSCRMDRRGVEEQEGDEASKKLVIKVVCSQMDQSKQPLSSSNPCLTDALDGRPKRFNRLRTLNPRKILLLFASMSSMGTMILIYFTLSINRQGET
ncbi:uncharacterized protein M6B38_206395 [Iris pallida]|uniref:Uncharacterized protein n=1 Tax=Iris pallida TaxID=29817 RepID=A0AAX6E635_IRIPA|nr:uncharacterized protein M6B38_206395 [Iris pallida]